MSTVTLAAPTLTSPDLLGDTLSVDVDTLPMVFLADAASHSLEVTIQETGEVFRTGMAGCPAPTVVAEQARFEISLSLPPALGAYHLTIRTMDAAEGVPTQVSPNFLLTVIRGTNEDVPQALPPAGIRVHRLADTVRVEWQTPQDPGFLGVRVVVSTDASGVTTPFVQVGDLIQGIDRRAQEVLLSDKRVVMNGAHRVTTLDEELATVPYSAIEFQRSSTPGMDVFYVALTTLIQDPDTHHVHESYAAGPLECSFVDLRKVRPTDFPGASTPEANAIALIKAITPLYPTLDLGPRTEARDLFVDPVAIEQAYESTRAWYTRVSQSVSALLAIDDADQDGLSDDPATSTYKQSLARAFRLTPEQMQSVIDTQFDVLGERAGVPRGGAVAAVTDVLFYTTSRPSRRLPISEGGVVNTLPDDDTPSVGFRILASAALDPGSADSFYIPEKGWWGITLPCMCLTEGSEGNVGAGTIRTVVTGVDSALQCTNLSRDSIGQDRESNTHYAAKIADRAVVGVDTGRRAGYRGVAQGCTGVIQAEPVCAGDLEMLRDWDPVRQKHLFGTVDIYARGQASSQSIQRVTYTHPTLIGDPGSPASYAVMTVANAPRLQLQFEHAPAHPVAALVELFADRNGPLSFYFGVERAQYDPETSQVCLHPEDLTYTQGPGGTRTLGGRNADLLAAVGNGVVLRALARTWGPLSVVPTQQPVTKVYAVTGEEGATGVVPAKAIRLIRTADPLLEGNSPRAGDRVTVDNAVSLQTLPVTFPTQGPDLVDLGEGVALALTAQGDPGDVLSVLSADAHTRYLYGVAYRLVPMGPYAHYGIQRLAGDPARPGGQIPAGEEVRVSFNRYRFREHLTLRTETLALQGNVFHPLTHPGLVANAWTPRTHGLLALVSDAALVAAGIAEADRWVKVTYVDAQGATALARPGRDYLLDIDTTTGVTRIARYAAEGSITSAIHDGAAVTVSYYTAESFQVVTGYPQFLQQITERLEATRHGGADVLVKTMHESLVDIDMTVVLAGNAVPEVLDRKIRTVVTAAFDSAREALAQAELVRQIKALPGVLNVRLPFRHMTKADGAYDVGMIIPTGTRWDAVAILQAQDPAWAYLSDGRPRKFSPRTFITRNPVLRYKTIPSGGLPDAYVGLLYEGEAFERCLTLEAFQAATSAAFYIIGINEHLGGLPLDSSHYGKILMVTPAPTSYRPQALMNPGLQAYRVTYQVFGEAGAQDIPISPTEYLRPGKITIDYVLEGVTR